MSLESSENREKVESVESHPLYKPLKRRCLILVDAKGNALDRTKPMRTKGQPDLAIVYPTAEGGEDLDAGAQNCEQFMMWAEELLTTFDKEKYFIYGDPSLFANDLPVDSRVLEIPDPRHAYKLAAAHESAYNLKSRVGLTFARFQAPRPVRDEDYDGRFCSKTKLPQQGTWARMFLDRVARMENLDLAGFGDPNADYILYTGGDVPAPYAYHQMEQLVGERKIEVIRPYQLVYGLQTGALIRAIGQSWEESFSDLCGYLEECRNQFGCIGLSSYSQDVFYFKSRT